MDRIRESFDSLPVAICFFDKNGVVRLINHRMLMLTDRLRKNGIQTFDELEAALEQPPETVCCLNKELRLYRFWDESVFQFTEKTIRTKPGIPYTQVTACDVTELLQSQNRLQKENERLKDANDRLRKLFEQMPDLIREEETLAMKLRVHDDIGYSILSARRLLSQQAGLDEIRAGAAVWEQSIEVLYRSFKTDEKQDALEEAVRRAEDICGYLSGGRVRLPYLCEQPEYESPLYEGIVPRTTSTRSITGPPVSRPCATPTARPRTMCSSRAAATAGIITTASVIPPPSTRSSTAARPATSSRSTRKMCKKLPGHPAGERFFCAAFRSASR